MKKVNDLVGKIPRHPSKIPTSRNWFDIALKDRLIVVHTTDWDTSIDTLVRYDLGPNHISSTGCPSITYHDVIMKDGTLNHCELYKNITWHAGKWNKTSVAIALMYKCTNLGKVDLSPTNEQLAMLERTLVTMCLALKVRPQDIKGHRELEDTGFIYVIDKDSGKARQSLLKTCPGMSIDLYALRKAVTNKLQLRLKVDGYYQGALDGDFGSRSTEALIRWKPK